MPNTPRPGDSTATGPTASTSTPCSTPSDGSSLTALLRAETEVVPFLGRDDELDRLRRWCASPSDRSVWAVTAPTGKGKTRLGRHLCRTLAGTGEWEAAQLDVPPAPAEAEELCRRTGPSGRSLLLVVDHADEHGAAALADLIGLLAGADAAPQRWRLLLLAVEAGPWWTPTRSAFTGVPISPSGPDRITVHSLSLRHGIEVVYPSMALGPLAPPGPRRTAVFEQVLAAVRPGAEAFAERHGLVAAATRVAPDLCPDDLGPPMLLQVAAVAAVLPPQAPPSPAGAADLVGHLLELESRHHWAGGADAAEQARCETAVATATLLGGTDRLPDRLAEDLVIKVVHQELADGAAATDLLPHRLLRTTGPGEPRPDQVRRLLTVLLRAGDRNPRIADLLAATPDGGGLVAAVPPRVDLRPVADALPLGRPNLLGACVTICAHAVRRHDLLHPGWRDDVLDTPTHRDTVAQGARLLLHLTRRTIEAGNGAEAEALLRDVVGLYRRLAAVDDAWLPDLAVALTNLSLRLIGTDGDRAGSVAAAREAVDIRRRLAGDDPSLLPDLAVTLVGLGNTLTSAGRRDEAVTAGQEAAEIYRGLAGTPQERPADLATALTVLGHSLTAATRAQEALTASEEALALRRRLAGSDPASRPQHLAAALDDAGTKLAGCGRQQEGVALIEEAVEMHRQFAGGVPGLVPPFWDLAAALEHLGALLSASGQRERALPLIEEAVTLRHRLVLADPNLRRSFLAGAQARLAELLHLLGRDEEALTYWQEVVAVRRHQAEARPARYLPQLVSALAGLADQLCAIGRQDEGLLVAQEAFGTSQRLPEDDSASRTVADLRAVLAMGTALMGRNTRSVLSALEVASVGRTGIIRSGPVTRVPEQVTALQTMADMLDAGGRHWEARHLRAMARRIRTRLRLRAALGHRPRQA